MPIRPVLDPNLQQCLAGKIKVLEAATLRTAQKQESPDSKERKHRVAGRVEGDAIGSKVVRLSLRPHHAFLAFDNENDDEE